MSSSTAALDYFKKMQRVINYEADFTFFDVKLIKKSKIDDLLCCIIATLPESYKKMMKQKEGDNLKSIVGYKLLFKSTKRKFIFSSNLYLVESVNAIKYLNSIIKWLEKDIVFIENMK